MSEMTYRDYQQVLDINIRAKAPKASSKRAINKISKQSPIRKRTKTGCLTCRKRKKKCDESVVNGKCQGCTRNFLDCCWDAPKPESPVVPATVARSNSVSSESSEASTSSSCSSASYNKCSISALLAPEDDDVSPLSSPRPAMKREMDVDYIALPPSRQFTRVQQSPKEPAPKFIVTSFNVENEMYQVPT
ncbi:hypothetical protein DICA0_D13014 [Diutina catenulata]